MKFRISKSELYRKIDEWCQENVLTKDDSNGEGKKYSQFAIRKTSQLEVELLSLYNQMMECFSYNLGFNPID